MMINNKTLTTLAGFMAAGSMSASGAVLLAGWDTWDDGAAPTATHVAAGLTATAAGSGDGGTNWSFEGGGNAGRGSSGDGTWGSFDGGGTGASTSTILSADNVFAPNGRVSSEYTFTISNVGTVDMAVEGFHMDALRWRPNAADSYALTVVSGDITNGAVTGGSGSLTNHGGASLANRDLHDQVDIDLTGLADYILAAGESAVIRIDFTGGTGSGAGHHLFLDNVAFSGAAIPEPSSALLLGLSGLALMARRRK